MNTSKKKYRLKNKESEDINLDEMDDYLLEDKDESELKEELEDFIEEIENEEDSEDEEFEDEEIEDEPQKKKPRNKKKADKDRYYVNPLEFDKEIGSYYDSGHMSDNLATMISNIANKLSYAPNFINYTFREEMVGDGIIRMFKALTTKKYDHQKGATASAGPFSYFTRIAFNAFRNRIKKEKHMRETHEKYQNELSMFSENYNTITKNNQQRISVNPNSYY